MPDGSATPSPRRLELTEAAYEYVLEHGLADLSLRPLAGAIGSSPRVLIFLFGSKDGLVKALLNRARGDELRLLDAARAESPIGLPAAVERTWEWLAAERHRPLLRLWAEAYARSLVEPEGAWAGFARATVADWLAVLDSHRTDAERSTPDAEQQLTLALAVLRGLLLDLLATGDVHRTGAALAQHVNGYLTAVRSTGAATVQG